MSANPPNGNKAPKVSEILHAFFQLDAGTQREIQEQVKRLRDPQPSAAERDRAEKALVTVIQEAWIGGVSTRRVDELVQAMGLSGISKSQVSKLCKDIDERVNVFLDRPIEGEWPYLWLDATYLKVRDGGRIVSVAAIIAVAANSNGRREIVGLHRTAWMRCYDRNKDREILVARCEAHGSFAGAAP